MYLAGVVHSVGIVVPHLSLDYLDVVSNLHLVIFLSSFSVSSDFPINHLIGFTQKCEKKEKNME